RAQAAEGGGGEHAFGRATRTHDRVHVGSGDRDGERSHEIAVLDELDPCARGTHVVDELFVPRTVEDDDGQVAHVAIERLRDDLEILGDRPVKVDLAASGRTDDELLHIGVGRVQKTARL